MKIPIKILSNTRSSDDPSVTTLGVQLMRCAEQYPRKIAIIDRERSTSYEELSAYSFALANMLHDMGIGKGDRVGCLVRKNTDAMIAFLGIAVAGTVFFSLDPNQPRKILHSILEIAQPKAIFVAEEFLDLIPENMPATGWQRIVIGTAHGKDTNFEAFRTHLSRPHHMHDVLPSDLVYLNFTSGTTGKPKAVVTTHAHIFWNTRASVETFSLQPEDVHLCMFPAFVHPHELFARPLFLGGTMVLLDSIQPKSIASVIAMHQVTAFMAVASIYETLVRLGSKYAPSLSSLRIAESGGMHFTRTLAQTFRSCFDRNIYPVWGSTETTGIAIATPWDAHPSQESYRAASMGKLCPYYTAQVITDEGQDTAPGEIGELLLHGPAVCQEYFRNPTETGAHFHDGWFHTGDLVRRDTEGYFYFCSRRSGMMKVAGMKVFPIEIEEVLRAHPDILEVVVVKANTAAHGEAPRAVIAPRPGAELTAYSVRKYCEQHLHRCKIPREIDFCDALPRTPGGKIAWKELG